MGCLEVEGDFYRMAYNTVISNDIGKGRVGVTRTSGFCRYSVFSTFGLSVYGKSGYGRSCVK